MTDPLQVGLIVLAVVLAAVAIGLHLYKARRAWRFVNVKGDFTEEHHLPEVLPVPVSEEARAIARDFSFDEALSWMRQFLAAGRRHPLRAEFQLALRKADYYKQLSDRMGKGRWGEVDELATRLAQLDPLDPSAALARGRAMRQMGRLASAVHFYKQALKLQPTHSLALPEFAATCRELRQPHRFRKALETARRQLGDTHPLTIESRVQLGELVRIFADPADPATMAHIPRQQYLANMRMRLEEMEPDLASAVPLGQSMLEDDMPELAHAVAERVEAIYGERAEVLLLRGMIQHYEQDLPGAEQLFRRSIEAEDIAAARLELGRALHDQAKQTRQNEKREQLAAQAQQELRLAIERDHDLPEAIALLVEPQQEQGLDAVAAAIEPIANAYPESWAPWKVLADACVAEEQWERARQACEAGLQRQRVDPLLLIHMLVLHELGDKSALEQAAAEINDLDQRDPTLRWHVAQVWAETEKRDEAKRVLQSILEDDRSSPMLRQRARAAMQELQSSSPEEAGESSEASS